MNPAMNTNKYLFLNTRDEFHRVRIPMIVYFEADGNYTNFFLGNGLKGQAPMNLARMQETLGGSLGEAASIFARVGKRHIINLNHVYHIDVPRQRLTLSDGERFLYHLSVSKDALRKLKDMYVASITGK